MELSFQALSKIPNYKTTWPLDKALKGRKFEFRNFLAGNLHVLVSIQGSVRFIQVQQAFEIVENLLSRCLYSLMFQVLQVFFSPNCFKF